MSLGIYPVFDPELRGTTFKALGEVLAHNYEMMDRIAKAAKLRPFTAFADTRVVPANFNGAPENLEDILGPWTGWFDPAEGRAVILDFVSHIKAHPEAAKRLDDPTRVIEELEEIVRVLAVAEKETVKFRLHMS